MADDDLITDRQVFIGIGVLLVVVGIATIGPFLLATETTETGVQQIEYREVLQTDGGDASVREGDVSKTVRGFAGITKRQSGQIPATGGVVAYTAAFDGDTGEYWFDGTGIAEYNRSSRPFVASQGYGVYNESTQYFYGNKTMYNPPSGDGYTDEFDPSMHKSDPDTCVVRDNMTLLDTDGEYPREFASGLDYAILNLSDVVMNYETRDVERGTKFIPQEGLYVSAVDGSKGLTHVENTTGYVLVNDEQNIISSNVTISGVAYQQLFSTKVLGQSIGMAHPVNPLRFKIQLFVDVETGNVSIDRPAWHSEAAACASNNSSR